MALQVRKKDGRLEDFDRFKIHNGLNKAGVAPEEAEKITAEVETWVETEAENGIVDSSEIREKVLGILDKANPQAAASFRAYKKPQ